MNARDVFCGVLSGVVIVAALNWLEPKQTTRAALLAAPPESRFEVIQLHANASAEWSGILDTETGCLWTYTSQKDTGKESPEAQAYLELLGSHELELVNYSPDDYMPLPQLNSSDPFGPSETELGRVARLCEKSRIRALESSATR